MKNQIKNIQYQEISILNICDAAKQICPKKKKNVRKDTLQISLPGLM